MSKFTSVAPHLFQAYYNWLNENGVRVDIIIDNRSHDSKVLKQYEDEYGCVRLNISPAAIRDVFINNDFISFQARFNGVAAAITLNYQCILGILYKGPDDNNYYVPMHPGYDTVTDFEPPAPNPPAPKGRPTLKVVK